jgi:putative membrane protein
VQPLGKALVTVHTSAPNPTDDVDFPVGRSVQDAFRRRGVEHPFFSDAHNCLERGGGAVHFGTHEAEELLKQADEAASAYVKPDGSLRAGFAQTAGFDKTRDGIGAQGIQVAVIEAGGHKMAYILLDGNNMVKGLREKILEAVKGPGGPIREAGAAPGPDAPDEVSAATTGASGALVDEAEVLTTDNHCVHATMGGYNPVGSRYPNDKLAEMARETVGRAIADLEEVESGAGSKPVELRVFGHGNTARLTTAINSTVAVLRVGVGTCLAFALFGSFMLHYLAGMLL